MLRSEVQDSNTHPKHISQTPSGARLHPIDAKDCADGHSTVYVGGAIKGIHNYTELAPVGFFHHHYVIVFFADLRVHDILSGIDLRGSQCGGDGLMGAVIQLKMVIGGGIRRCSG